MKNEAGNATPLLEELTEVLRPLCPFEVIVVDDGSTDETWAELLACQEKWPQLRLVKMDQNYGQSTAFWAGLKRVRGEFAAMMDGDMQNDPHDLPKLLEAVRAGADVCLTYRANRQDSRWKKLQSRIGNGFRNRLLKSDIIDTGSQLRVFRAQCLEDLPFFNGMHRFMGNLFLMRGWSLVQLATHHRSRFRGTTKYGMANRAMRGLKDLIGMMWLNSRTIQYGVAEEKEGPESRP